MTAASVGTGARYVASRVLIVIGVAVFASLVTFVLLRLTRDPVDIVGAARGMDVTDQATRSELAREFGTSTSLGSQYLSWLTGAAQGDLGTSYLDQDERVSTIVAQGLPVNLELILLAQLLSLGVAIPIGLWGGAHAGGRVDTALSTMSVAMLSAPGFVVAIGLIMLFAIRLPWLPVTASGYVSFTSDPLANLRQMALPAIALAIPMTGVYARVLRADVVSTMSQEFITTAKTKGLSRTRILARHVLRSSSLTLIPVIALQSGALLGGSILIEQIFAFPVGLGSSLATAAIAGDTPVLLGISTTIAVGFAILTTAADALARIADPRIRAN